MKKIFGLFLVALLAIAPALAQGGIVQVATSTLEDGRLLMFAVDSSGNLWTCWKATTAGDSSWTDWQSYPDPGTPIRQVVMDHLPDSRIQLFAVDTSGGMWTMWKQTTDPNAGWTQWQAFQVPGAASSSRGYTTANVKNLNPQALNPQPLPPGLKQQSLVKNVNPLALNPQPLPPG